MSNNYYIQHQTTVRVIYEYLFRSCGDRVIKVLDILNINRVYVIIIFGTGE